MELISCLLVQNRYMLIILLACTDWERRKTCNYYLIFKDGGLFSQGRSVSPHAFSSFLMCLCGYTRPIETLLSIFGREIWRLCVFDGVHSWALWFELKLWEMSLYIQSLFNSCSTCITSFITHYRIRYFKWRFVNLRRFSKFYPGRSPS